jgi:hypothetical protein
MAAVDPFRPGLVQSQRVGNSMCAVLPGQFDRSLPQWLRQLRRRRVLRN